MAQPQHGFMIFTILVFWCYLCIASFHHTQVKEDFKSIKMFYKILVNLIIKSYVQKMEDSLKLLIYKQEKNVKTVSNLRRLRIHNSGGKKKQLYFGMKHINTTCVADKSQ
jgi:hypothetical protein